MAALTYRLTGQADEAGSLTKPAAETPHVGYDGVLYLEHPEPGQWVEVTGVC